MVLVFGISVVVHAPAAFVINQMPKIRGLILEGVQGSIWQGSAQNVVWKRDNIGQVSWNFQPVKLFSGKAEFMVRFGRGSDLDLQGKGMVGADLQGVYAEKILASMPAASVLKKVTVPVPVDVAGQLELTIQDYRYAQPWCESATGSLVWNGSEVRSPIGTLVPGMVIADLSCNNSKLAASGTQNNKQVSAEFSAELQPNRRYSLDAWFKPGAEFPSSMQAQLKWLGNPDAQGRYPLTYLGRL
ncbi:general secretion pathway protein GspN [Vibrio albus]|uniref:Type II secretion system protein N n=2 Tax=Vibrio albus TaxID=2200953 RepID=A0A2U3B8R9_9VIBR|nr:type II secretion system protein N [Vibrio albus]PWI33167.1 general secretion pathway protein GspN [Vibrio albus]